MTVYRSPRGRGTRREGKDESGRGRALGRNRRPLGSLSKRLRDVDLLDVRERVREEKSKGRRRGNEMRVKEQRRKIWISITTATTATTTTRGVTRRM